MAQASLPSGNRTTRGAWSRYILGTRLTHHLASISRWESPEM